MGQQEQPGFQLSSAIHSHFEVRKTGDTKEASRVLQGATVIQLLPYGWELPDGSGVREQVYKGMADAANATYVRWINPDAANAHFRECAHLTPHIPRPSAASACSRVTQGSGYHSSAGSW